MTAVTDGRPRMLVISHVLPFPPTSGQRAKAFATLVTKSSALLRNAIALKRTLTRYLVQGIGCAGPHPVTGVSPERASVPYTDQAPLGPAPDPKVNASERAPWKCAEHWRTS